MLTTSRLLKRLLLTKRFKKYIFQDLLYGGFFMPMCKANVYIWITNHRLNHEIHIVTVFHYDTTGAG